GAVARATRGRDGGAVARAVGMVAGLAALGAGGIAAGLELERRVVGSRFRNDRTPREAFFSLRSGGPPVRTSDGLDLHTEIDELDDHQPAPGSGPVHPELTVVMVHGYALSLDCFHFQRKHLRGRARLVLYDQRSHGRSPRAAPETCRIDQLGDDLLAVLQQTGVTGPVVLVGHSMGGMTIMNLARRHPELFGDLVGGVVLISTSPADMAEHSPIRGIPGRTFSRVVEPALALLNRVPDLVTRSRRAGSDLGFVATKQLAFGSEVPAQYVEFVSEMLGDIPLEVVGDFYPAFRDLDETGSFPVLAGVETAVVGGEDDAITPIEHTQVIIELLPGADALVLENSGHMALIEHHVQVDEVIDALLVRVTRNAG
ncbi:alpha/beta fold hydrolase, partial [Desertihabitans aurantiacus]|uniref:alpha/beta fold hydrolase n=1 Tax=Desertihabitans aurantiacus TaxID=2282477 RepID=UPI0013006D87